MAIIIEFRWLGKAVQATIDRHVWTCDDPRILRSIKLSAAIQPDNGYHPYLDYAEAEFVIKHLSYLQGRIVHADPAPRGQEGVYHGTPPLMRAPESEDGATS